MFRIKDEREAQESVRGAHGVHPYPGRMHPLWARRILAALPDDASVLDPFCGSGTVLIEARKRGVHARGSDVNPIAVRLARLKCIPHADPEAFLAEADRCAQGCTKRRDTPFSALAAEEENKAFPRHVLAGLISLRDEIARAKDDKVREALLFCMSPLLDKLAGRPGTPPPRVSRTAVRDFFRQRADLWVEVWQALDGHRWAEVEAADAKWLPWKPGTSTAVVTSPPYPGVFDYAAMQRRRTLWLGSLEELKKARKVEIGRRYTRAMWADDMHFALKQMARTVKPGSPLYLVVGDGIMSGKVVRTDRVLEKLCVDLPLEHVATAGQERPHFHKPTQSAFSNRPKMEHLVLLRRT